MVLLGWLLRGGAAWRLVDRVDGGGRGGGGRGKNEIWGSGELSNIGWTRPCCVWPGLYPHRGSYELIGEGLGEGPGEGPGDFLGLQKQRFHLCMFVFFVFAHVFFGIS